MISFVKSLRENLPSLRDFDKFSHLTQHSARHGGLRAGLSSAVPAGLFFCHCNPTMAPERQFSGNHVKPF